MCTAVTFCCFVYFCPPPLLLGLEAACIGYFLISLLKNFFLRSSEGGKQQQCERAHIKAKIEEGGGGYNGAKESALRQTIQGGRGGKRMSAKERPSRQKFNQHGRERTAKEYALG